MEELVLVRHGESEGNLAFNKSMQGDHSLYSGKFLERHSSLWRLTDRGREQVRTADPMDRATACMCCDLVCRLWLPESGSKISWKAASTAGTLRSICARWRLPRCSCFQALDGDTR